MTVIEDQWTPFFAELEEKVNSAGRTSLLTGCIDAVHESALSNFGEFARGDMRPWYAEQLVSKSYARTVKRDFATLERSEEEREACEGTRWQGGQGAHLKDSFFTFGGGDSMSLANIADYASDHQNGEGVPRRPFFPVSEDGQLMPFMQSRIFQIADAHFQV
jgi:hypothetical protein